MEWEVQGFCFLFFDKIFFGPSNHKLHCLIYEMLYKMDVILLFDQYLLVEQQNDTHII